MAEITALLKLENDKYKRAIEFDDGDVLFDISGHIGLRTEKHIVRVHTVSSYSLYVLELRESRDLFIKAPFGASFTVTAQ